MNKLVENISDSQSEKMDQIAKEFVTQMDKAMGVVQALSLMF